MNYLDERIIVTCTPSEPFNDTTGLRFDVYRAQELIFVGRCWVNKGDTSKTIDITDFCRNYYDFGYQTIKEEYQFSDNTWYVKLTNTAASTLENVTSNYEVVVPIYRYPDRKASMETHIVDGVVPDPYFLPVLQGYTSRSGQSIVSSFYPRIPFVYSDKIDFPITLNTGLYQASNIWKLYTGVWKTFDKHAQGFSVTNNTFKELWQGDIVQVQPFNIGETLDNLDFPWGTKIEQRPKLKIFKADKTQKGIIEFSGRQPSEPLTINVSFTDGTSDDIPITKTPFTIKKTYNLKDAYQDNNIDIYFNNENDSGFNVYPALKRDYDDIDITIQYIVRDDFKTNLGLITEFEGATKTSTSWMIAENGAGKIKVEFLNDNNEVVFEQDNIDDGDTVSINDTYESTKMRVTSGNNTYTATLSDVFANGEDRDYLFAASISVNQIDITPIECWWECAVVFNDMKAKTHLATEPKDVKITFKKKEPYSTNAGYYQKDDMNYDIVYGSGSIDDTGHYINHSESAVTESYFGFVTETKDGEWVSGCSVTKDNPALSVAFGGPKNDLGDVTYFGLVYGTDMDGNDTYLVDELKVSVKEDLPDYWVRFTQISAAYPVYNAYQNRWNYSVSPNIIHWNKKLTEPPYTKIADVDTCPSRYYLQWRDRNGGMQMQPFQKTDTYSEDFTRGEIKNYYNQRKLSSIDIQPKWKINTGWLNNTVYPYYESIFVSPWLKLYDSKEDQVYDVIINDSSYTEKTFKNQGRQKFNLQLDVEEVKTQNILY